MEPIKTTPANWKYPQPHIALHNIAVKVETKEGAQA
jgi:hypothetical protein